jgi:uncharacterized protein (DUF1778 family)
MPEENRFSNADPERQQVARDASEAVKQAASILQKELSDSAGLASEMQQKFSTTRRVEQGEFKVLADRVRKDVHDLIAIASEMFTELRTDEVQSLVTRIATDAHDVVDTTMNLVENTPEAATRFAQLGFTTPPSPGGTPPSGDPPSPDPGGETPLPDPPAVDE